MRMTATSVVWDRAAASSGCQPSARADRSSTGGSMIADAASHPRLRPGGVVTPAQNGPRGAVAAAAMPTKGSIHTASRGVKIHPPPRVPTQLATAFKASAPPNPAASGRYTLRKGDARVVSARKMAAAAGSTSCREKTACPVRPAPPTGTSTK